MNANLIQSPNITGNIGSCEVKSVSYQNTIFTARTTAVNSCTGQILADNVYFDTGWLFGTPLIILLFIGVAWAFKKLFKQH